MTSEIEQQRYPRVTEFVARALAVLGERLCSAVLFGSAAEGRLRPVSDVNLLLVLREWHRAELDQLREPLRTMRAAIDLQVMLVLEAELPQVVESFAVKFSDIAGRHRVLHGAELGARLRPSQAALRARTGHELLNLTLRLRERYVSLSLREEQSVRALARFAGGLRACASAVLTLRGTPAPSGREALETVARQLGPAFVDAVAALSQAREHRPLSGQAASDALLALGELARRCVELLDEPTP
jgi:predicted nucleotidyltransferase